MHINFKSMPAQSLRHALLANAIFSVTRGSLMVFTILQGRGLRQAVASPVPNPG